MKFFTVRMKNNYLDEIVQYTEKIIVLAILLYYHDYFKFVPNLVCDYNFPTYVGSIAMKITYSYVYFGRFPNFDSGLTYNFMTSKIHQKKIFSSHFGIGQLYI